MTTVGSSSIIKKLVTITLSFAVIVSGFFLFAPESADAAPSTELVDSGIDYTDGIEKAATEDPNTGKTVYVDALHMNPYRGIHVWAADLELKKSDDTSVNKAVEPYLAAKMKERSLGYLAVDISDFSGAYHLTDDDGRGPDAKLTESALAAIDQTLKNLKKNNMQVIIRFVYDKNNNGIEDDEGCLIPDSEVVVPKDWKNYNRVVEARQGMIMQHIEQLAPILIDNQDAIYTVQVGFYGGYGELHSTGACSDAYIAEALDKMLTETKDSNLRISVRTPRRYAYYRFGSTDIYKLANDVTSEDEDAYRAAIFNDGYLGTDNDWGTFENREIETDWMATQNLHNPYGGDAIPAPGETEIGDPAKPPFVINEMFKVHTSYIAPVDLLVSYWKETPYDESQYNVKDYEYSGATLYEYIENHLGYRFVLRESKLSESVKAGGTLENTFEIENVGFGNLFYPMQSYAYITDEYGKVVVGPTEVDVDPTNFEVNKTTSGSMGISIPENMEPGKYNLYLQFKIGDRVVDGTSKPYGAIRLANRNVWNAGLEANYMGSFKVNREVKITKTWEDESFADARPDSLTFTIEKTRVPREYQEVENIEANGTQWIDTGIASDASHTIYSEGCAYEGKASGLLQSYVDNNNRLGFKLYGGSKKAGCYWRISGGGQGYKDISSEELGDIDVTKKLQMTQSAAGLVIKQGDLAKTVSYSGSASGSTGGNWMIFKSNENESCGILYEAKIIDSSGLIHHYIPCYRKSDNVIGVYDTIAGIFLTNGGEGTFGKGNDVTEPEYTVTKTISKDDWSISGNTWETTVTLDGIGGDLSIYEHDVENYKSDATADSRKTIGDSNEVSIKNTLTAEICEVTFDLDGGTLPGRGEVFKVRQVKNRYITIPKETPTKAGYVFQYWKGSKYMPGEVYKVTDNHYFKAIWIADKSGSDGASGDNDASDADTDGSGGADTGDRSNVAIWIALLAAAVATVIAVIILRRRRDD